MSRNNESSRRTFLKATAATGTVVGVGSIVSGQERQEFVFGGEVPGWMGREPSEIEGQTNPTLELSAGQEYAFTWENTDGLPHNVAIVDTEGNVLEQTEIISEQGETQTLQFTATQEMAEYVCEVHPNSMRGDIRFEGETTTAGEEEEVERFMPRGAGIGVEQIADGFVSPVGLEAAPGDDERRFILDQVGQLYVHGPDGLQDEPFLNIEDRMVNVGGREGSDFDERGLLGVAFHPDFQNNGRMFVRYSAPLTEPPFVSSVDWSDTEDLQEYDHVEVLSEFQASDDLSSADPESETRLLEMPSPQFNHNAGAVAFGSDGYLYVPTGDGGDADDTGLGHVEDWYDQNEGGNGQDVTQNLMGGVLRIDVDNEGDDLPYAIPDDNPFAEGGEFSDYDGLPEYYAWGFRNPWKASFNDGELFAASNGQNLFEQVDVVQQGGNHAWNVKEATHCFSTENPNDPPEECPNGTPDDVRGGEEFVDPIVEYPHTYQGRGVGVSVIGGYMYNNDAIEGVTGKYVFGDYSRTGADPAGRIFAASPPEGDGQETTPEDGGQTTTEGGGQTTTAQGGADELWDLEELQIAGAPNGKLNKFVLSFGRDNEGQLYVLGNDTGTITGETGEVYRIVPAGEGGEVTTPQMETTTTEAVEEETTAAEGEATMTTTETDG